MLIRTVISPLLGAACYLVADTDRRCVVVDPGVGVADAVLEQIDRFSLVPVGVLVTHGHVDHTWDAAAVCRELDLPLWVHQDDAYRIDDPIGSLGPLGAQLATLAGAAGGPERPERVLPYVTGPSGRSTMDVGGFMLTAMHAPGHTQGSTIYLLRPSTVTAVGRAPAGEGLTADAEGWVALTGDVLFAGTIGRTDLPGGDPVAMARTLARVAELEPATRVLPGHGPASTIAVELATNPHLRGRGWSSAH